MIEQETDAIRADASDLDWLYGERQRLLPDADDAEALSELTWVETRITLAKQELAR